MPSDSSHDSCHLAEQVAALRAELDRAIQEHSEARAQWEAWISLLSHDLRGPLTLILGYTDGLLHRYRDESDERLIHDLRAIIAGARRMNKMVGQIVDGARLEIGHLVLQLESVEIAAILKEEIQRHRHLDPSHPIKLSVGASLPTIRGDSRRLALIVATLLSNAALFSPPGEPIRVAARKVGASVVVSVQDSGVGLSDDDLCRLFEQRFRPERNREPRREGLGLSLWIAREIAQLHQGALRGESAGLNRGTTFYLELPAE